MDAMTADRSVREATAADLPALATMLSAAFEDDAVMRFIFPDPAVRRARLPSFFTVILKADRAAGACFMTSTATAATTWRAPGRGHLSLVEMVGQGLPWINAARTGLARALIYSAASDANHPKEPHWYLHLAGCEPAAQGKGFGGTAIRAGLARADAEGVAAYLETATPSNIPLYTALGFAVTHEWTIQNGPCCWSMLRSAR